VRVYAGTDPVTKKRHYLTEIIEPGPKARRRAEDALRRLVSEVEERRSPRTNATVDQLLERYMSQFDGSPNTLVMPERHPITLAKTVSCVDLVSKGRVVLGVGAGWNVEELRDHGVEAVWWLIDGGALGRKAWIESATGRACRSRSCSSSGRALDRKRRSWCQYGQRADPSWGEPG
jgi:hypothetical protein